MSTCQTATSSLRAIATIALLRPIRGASRFSSLAQCGCARTAAWSADVAATIFHSLGYAPDTEIRDVLDRPLPISRGQVMDVSAARASLLLSLEDRRPEIVMLVGQTLALIDSPDAQAGLLNKALADDVGDDVEISLLNSLATSAKFFGNRLDAGSTERLLKVVAEETNLDVRSAAAEAHGALNLPADAAKKLIVDQMKV